MPPAEMGVSAYTNQNIREILKCPFTRFAVKHFIIRIPRKFGDKRCFFSEDPEGTLDRNGKISHFVVH